jgi:hypothetical protein
MKDQNNCSLVLIRWQDSRQADGAWRYLSELDTFKPVECASVGWLIRDDTDVKVLCQTIGDADYPEKLQASGVTIIPTCCVTAVETLTEETTPSPSSTVETEIVECFDRQSLCWRPR